MKKLLGLAILCQFLVINAQENAINFIIPKVNAVKTLYSSGTKSLTGDIADLSKPDYSTQQIEYQPQLEADGSITYKIIFYKANGVGMLQDYAYFVNFSGNKASFKGYSKYVLKTQLFSDDIANEEYTALNNEQQYYIVPSESYQTTEWTYVDPATKLEMNAKGYYKTMTVNGVDERIFVVEHSKKSGYSDKARIEYFMKNYGIIATQANQGEIVYITDLKPYKLYSKSYIDNLSEADAMNKGWDIIDNIRNIMDQTDSFPEQEEKLAKHSMDSLVGLFEHLMRKNIEKEKIYRYVLSLIYDDWTDEYYYTAKRAKRLKYSYENKRVLRSLNNYFFLRLYPGYVPKAELKGIVTKVDENFYKMYWTNLFIYFNTVAEYAVKQTYYVYLFKDKVELVERSESTIDGKNLFLLHSYLASYYGYKGDPAKAYFNYVLTLENYKSLTNEEKDLNMEYMKILMKKMTEEKPSNEADLIRGINAAISLNDNINALKIADNGYSNGVGNSVNFSMLFAKVAYENSVDKNYLRKAMQLMQNKISEMKPAQIKEYLIYCKAMSPEYDCSKAEAEVKKAEKREKEEQEKKAKEEKKKSKKNNYSSNRAMNFAIAANPFAGLNISGNGHAFNFLPLSAELRTGVIIHELRINTFNGLDAKNRFVAGKLIENAPPKNGGWKNIRGADYSYGIYFVKNKMSSYKKNCESLGGGLQFLYGSFTTNPEKINVTMKNIPTIINVKPEINRYEVLLNYKLNIYDRKTHFFFTTFWGLGAGVRNIKYNATQIVGTSISEGDLKDNKSVFDDKRFTQQNWTGYYFTIRLGFRFGLTLF